MYEGSSNSDGNMPLRRDGSNSDRSKMFESMINRTDWLEVYLNRRDKEKQRDQEKQTNEEKQRNEEKLRKEDKFRVKEKLAAACKNRKEKFSASDAKLQDENHKQKRKKAPGKSRIFSKSTLKVPIMTIDEPSCSSKPCNDASKMQKKKLSRIESEVIILSDSDSGSDPLILNEFHPHGLNLEAGEPSTTAVKKSNVEKETCVPKEKIFIWIDDSDDDKDAVACNISQKDILSTSSPVKTKDVLPSASPVETEEELIPFIILSREKVLTFTMRAHEKFGKFFPLISQHWDVPVSHIMLSLGNTILKVSDTPDSLQLLVGGMIDLCATGGNTEIRNNNPNLLSITLQTKMFRKKYKMLVHPMEPFSKVFQRFSEERSLGLDKFYFNFDGEKILPNDTPFALEIEDGYIVDVVDV